MAKSEKAASLKGKFVLNRDKVLASTMGHVIHFVKGEPVFVPKSVVREAMAIGAVPADGDDAPVNEAPAPDAPPTSPEERAERIMEGILQLVKRNQRGDFTAANNPSATALSDLIKFKVDAKEIAPVWQQYHNDLAEAETANRLAEEAKSDKSA